MDRDKFFTSGGEGLDSVNAAYIEALQDDYLSDPKSVPAYWREVFQRSELGYSSRAESTHAAIREALRAQTHKVSDAPSLAGTANHKQVDVIRLISAYRYLGHRQADIDPLAVMPRSNIEELDLGSYDLGREDMDTVFETGSIDGIRRATLREILNMLSVTYCGTIGSEFEHIISSTQKEWIQRRLEQFYFSPDLPDKRRRRILEILVAAKSLEVYLHKKYVGQKRFSLEGGLSLIPIIDEIIKRCRYHRAKEVIMGMAHRGRLNVLVNILGKSPEILFQEFEDSVSPENGSGDVKYHQGFASDLETDHGPIHVVLAFNPSHLEAINPVVEGSVRARQQRRGDAERKEVIPVLVHGDAAFAGQGVVMETLNLSKTRGYTTGGTIHVIVNNQIGFTTSDPLDSRPTLYCTDVAKMVEAPIFHVNGDDPEAAVFVAQLAVDFRMKFKSDVVIDMVCYRQHGHHEADEPAITQPVIYQRIGNMKGVRDVYANRLIQDEVVTPSRVAALEAKYLERLQKGQRVCGLIAEEVDNEYHVDFKPYIGTDWREKANTCISIERINALTQKMTTMPEDFTLHRIVKRIIELRKKMGRGEVAADWGFGETLAYASLLDEGYEVRLSGQDSVRGTFSHRHAAFYDQSNGEAHIPLQYISENQPLFLPINSLLSEEAVLGYEVGYSTSDPKTLVIWESQFGDFANNAQVYVDQFLSSAEAKWRHYCGLVVLLPHGYDGQGPEHSSARLERYLQQCAEDNIQVCMPSKPAQVFHLLRRQILRPYRKPLIVMTPKNILRDPMASSELGEFTDGGFSYIIDEVDGLKVEEVRKIILCAGKLYYELLQVRREHKITDTAIVRIEQLYPFPLQEVKHLMDKYANADEVVWAQEEPRNQGAWRYMQSRRHLKLCLRNRHRLHYVGRPYSASPAAGSFSVHRGQQRALIEEALGLREPALRRPSLQVV